MRRHLEKLSYFLCYVIAFVFGMKQLREPDVWWQLLAGKWMLQHRQVTHTDMFSYTMAGHPWINVKWLYEILIATLEKALGPEGVLLLQGLVNVAIVYLMIRSLKELSGILKRPAPYFYTLISILLFLVTVEYRMAGRPEMVSHLMCALYLYILLRSADHSWKQLVWLVPLQCLWANMHEGYPVGMVIVGAFAAGSFLSFIKDKDRALLAQGGRLTLLFAAMALVILINPNGIQLWKQPFEIYRQVWANKYTTELYAFYNPEYWTPQAKLYTLLLVMVVLYWANYLLRSIKTKDTAVLRPVVVAYMLLIVLFAYLSLTANRNIPFSAIVLFPTVPLTLYDVIHRLKIDTLGIYVALKKQATLIICTVALVLYISIVNNSYYKATASVNRYGLHVNMLHNPVGAAAYIKEHSIGGTAFSDYFVSSYLLWDMYPEFRSYIDLRDLDVFPASFFDDYFKLYEHPKLFNELDKKYNFNYVVISTSQLAGLQMQLYWKQGFNMVYADPVATIFLKSSEQNKPINNNPALQKAFTWPQQAEEPVWASALTRLFNPNVNYSDEDGSRSPVLAALFYDQLRDYPQALHMLLPHMGPLQDDAEANSTMAKVYMDYAEVTGDPELKQKRVDSANAYIDKAKQ